MKKNIDDFIKEHTHINYCECIIYPDGEIEYAVPSHTECLIKVTGEDRQYIYDIMPVTASPIYWLADYTKCVAVYTNGFILPKGYTTAQVKSLNKLCKANLTQNVTFG